MGDRGVELGEGLRLRRTVKSVMLPTSFNIGGLVLTGLFLRVIPWPRRSTEEVLEVLSMFVVPFDMLVLRRSSCGEGGPGDGALRLNRWRFSALLLSLLSTFTFVLSLVFSV